MGTDTVPVSSHCDLCDAAAGGTRRPGPLGRGGALPLCDNSLHPDLLEVGFRTMPASSLVVQGSPGAANGRQGGCARRGSLRSAVPGLDKS